MAGTVIADKWQNGDGTENYKCRAWVNFNGTGTVAIRANGNVSSITDNGTGDYTVNFTTAISDVNYAALVTIGGTASSVGGRFYDGNPLLTTSARVITFNSSWQLQDQAGIYISIFR